MAFYKWLFWKRNIFQFTYLINAFCQKKVMFASTYHVNFVFQDKQNGIGQDVVSQQSVLLRYSYDDLRRPMSVELSPGGLGRSLMTVKYAYLSGSAAERTTPLIASLNTSVKGSQAVTLEYS